MRPSQRMTGGIASTGHDKPTRKNCGREVAMNSTTAVSRCLNHTSAAWPRKLVARMKVTAKTARSGSFPRVENP